MPYSIHYHDGFFMVHDAKGKMYTKYKQKKDAENSVLLSLLPRVEKRANQQASILREK